MLHDALIQAKYNAFSMESDGNNSYNIITRNGYHCSWAFPTTAINGNHLQSDVLRKLIIQQGNHKFTDVFA